MSYCSRIGVFGGTFDPPHIGHLVAALSVQMELDLDRVVFVVANVPWQKAGQRAISAASDRVTMVEKAITDRPGFALSTMEIARGGDSVTAETLEQLAASCPDSSLHLILGSDAAAGLSSWRRANELAGMAELVVVERPGAAPSDPDERFPLTVVPSPLVDLSATELRERVREGRPIDYLVTDAVRDYIHERALYL